MAIQYGVAIPQMFHDEPVDMGLVRSYVARAEELGYRSLWVQEQIIGATAALEPLTLLSYVAGVTGKIRLGVAVIVLTTRNPVVLAKELGGIDQMSEGRLIVGVALGGRPAQYPLLGGPFERRVRHFEESLAVLKALWEQPRASFDGDFWKLDGEAMEPRPVQKPHPPVWFGGRNDAGLRRAARLADGWMGAGSTTTADFKRHVGVIREALESQERDPSEFPISKRVYIALDDDVGARGAASSGVVRTTLRKRRHGVASFRLGSCRALCRGPAGDRRWRRRHADAQPHVRPYGAP